MADLFLLIVMHKETSLCTPLPTNEQTSKWAPLAALQMGWNDIIRDDIIKADVLHNSYP